ncbi:MAG TPA: hypothetical protein VHE83_18745, partial [Mycobacteriales bacterium]|nr:hypothetical protein [Mycobacteriales bacterium]
MPRRSLVATVSALALGAASAAALVVTLGASPAAAVTGQSCPAAGCPTISGSLAEGQVVSASDGTFAGATSYTYRWQRCTSSSQVSSCNDISGANNQEYVIAPPDVSATEYLRVVVTGHDATTAAAEASDIAGPVQPSYNGPGLPSTGGGDLPPSVSDTTSSGSDFTPYVGDNLTSSSATWSSPSGTTTVYQWTRCNASGTSCAPIPGVPSSASPTPYTLTEADFSQTIRMRARGTNNDGTSEQYSSAVGPIERRPGSPTPTPTPTPSAGAGGDHTAPQTHFVRHPGALLKVSGAKARVRFGFAANEPSRFQCKLDVGPWRPCSAPTVLTVRATYGGARHTFKVRAIDKAGNVDPTPSSWTFVA